MICFPNAKINIGLQITGKRADGFHDIESIFYPVAAKDILELLPASSSQSNSIEFSSSGIAIPGNTSDNLCVKAYQLLSKDFPSIPSVRLHLHKHIPLGAGVGGGSADGAFALKLLNDKFQLGLSSNDLLQYASELGSDCPFFMINKPCFVSGRGEKLEQVCIDLSCYKILMVHPGIHINTGWAFSKITIQQHHHSLIEAINQPINHWKDAISNDFEKPVFEEFPVIETIKETLYQNGAIYASMSGSGSSVYAIFETANNFKPNFPSSYFCEWI